MGYRNVLDLTRFLCPQDWDIDVMLLESVLGYIASEEPEIMVLHAYTLSRP